MSNKWFEEFQKAHEALNSLSLLYANANDTITALRADAVLQDNLIESLDKDLAHYKSQHQFNGYADAVAAKNDKLEEELAAALSDIQEWKQQHEC
jgi:glutathionylspermidine synthase